MDAGISMETNTRRRPTGKAAMVVNNLTGSFLLIAVLLVSAWSARADTISGRVVGISDGDTITVLEAQRLPRNVRLAGIDAPEMGQPFGQASKANLSRPIFKKVVAVEYTKTDRCGRLIGKVLLDGRDMNLQQVSDGMAWHFKRYQNEQSYDDRQLYATTEQMARAERNGLWKDPRPVPPWEWRARKYEQSAANVN